MRVTTTITTITTTAMTAATAATDGLLFLLIVLFCVFVVQSAGEIKSIAAHGLTKTQILNSNVIEAPLAVVRQ
jgi:hypothetical protein